MKHSGCFKLQKWRGPLRPASIFGQSLFSTTELVETQKCGNSATASYKLRYFMYYKIIWVNSLHIGHFDLFVSWFLSQSFWEILRSKNYFRFICNAKISFTCIFPGWAKGFAVICAIKMWCLPKYIKYIKMWYLPKYIVWIMMLSIQWIYTYIYIFALIIWYMSCICV